MSDHLMIIRHAEKPGIVSGRFGVDAQGHPSEAGLSVRGWQRAGALVAYFAPRFAVPPDPRIDVPAALYAAADKPASHRPALTLQPLAAALGLHVRATFQSGVDELRLLRDAEAVDGPVLICWRHDCIPRFTQLLMGDTGAGGWDDDCFDAVWVLVKDTAGQWHHTVARQSLLAGDA